MFSGQLYFRRRNFFKLLWSNCFGTTVTLSEQLFLQSSCFFKELRFRKIYFLASIFFSEYLIFQSENSTKQAILENRKFFKAVTFRNSHILAEELIRKRYLQKSSFAEVGTTAQNQLFQKSYIFEKSNFSEKKYSAFSTFSGELPF